MGQAINHSEQYAPTASELAGLLAHDLRTPLNAVRGFSELLLAGAAGPLSGEARDLVAEIGRAGHALEEVVGLAQEIAVPPCPTSEIDRCALSVLLLEGGFTLASGLGLENTELVGHVSGWRRLISTCRAHLLDGGASDALSAGIRPGLLDVPELVLSSEGKLGDRPASVLRERLIAGLAVAQRAVLVSMPPHRPVRLAVSLVAAGR